MTLRAFLLGLVGAAIVCVLTYFNDVVIRQVAFLSGNIMPRSVYGGLMLFLLILNPILLLISKRLALRGKELAVVLAMTLAACCIPGTGLMKTFTYSLIMPFYHQRNVTGWKEQRVLEMTPKRMLVDVDFKEVVFAKQIQEDAPVVERIVGKITSRDDNEIVVEDRSGQRHRIPAGQVTEILDVGQGLVVDGFVNGLPREHWNEHISLSDIPWYAWSKALIFWLVVILSLWMGLIALSVVVHRQWSDHEQLQYPIARFANSLLPDEGQARGGVFASRLFWLGTGAVLFIHLNNYGASWLPDSLLRIPTEVDMTSLTKLFPTFEKGGGAVLLRGRIEFTLLAFAYFLATDVSLSLGVGSFLWCLVVGIGVGYGIPLGWAGSHAYLMPQIQRYLSFGAYFGILLVLVYTGRHYYSQVFRRALCLPGRGRAESQSVWAGRVFLLCCASFVVCLLWVGLDWPLAILYTAGTVMIFLVMARITAETGLFVILPLTFPCVFLWGVFGEKALGPEALLIMMLLTTVLLINPWEALMPLMVNALKVVDLRRVRVGKTAAWCAVAVVVGLAVAIPATLYFQYDQGADMSDWWGARAVPKMAFYGAVKVKQLLIGQGNLDLANSLSGLERFGHMAPKGSYLVGFGAGLVLVLVFSVCRLRFARWPLHPVLFLVWATGPGRWFAFSFLVGWFIKTAVTKYGGAKTYQRLKPLMFGLIAGDMLGIFIPTIIGLIYYWLTGEPVNRPHWPFY